MKILPLYGYIENNSFFSLNMITSSSSSSSSFI